MGQLTDLGAHTLRSGVAALGVRFAQAALSLVALIVLARLLTPEDFGVVAMVVPFVILTNTMGNQGFQTTLIQAPELTPAQASGFFSFAVRVNLALSAGFAAMSVVLAWFYEEPRVIPLSVAWALLIWLLTPTSFQEGMLKREMRFPIVLAIHLAAVVAGVACGIVAAHLGAGYWSFLVQAAVVEAVRVPGIHLVSGWRPATARDDAAPLRAFWRSLAGFRVASWVSEQPDRLLVGRLGGAATLGLYDTAQRWSWYPFAEPFLALSDIAVVSLSRVRRDAGQYRLFFERESRALLTLGLPVIAFVVVEAASVVRVLLGAQWDGAVPYVRLLGLAAFFGSLTRLTQWIYFSSGRTDRLLRWWLRVQTPVLFVAALTGALYGPRGVAIGYVTATVLLVVPSLAWCVSGTPISLGSFFRAAARPAAAALGSALALAAAAPLLPDEIGGDRLAAAFALYVGSFVVLWLLVPGGRRAAGELLAAVRELRRRSEG